VLKNTGPMHGVTKWQERNVHFHHLRFLTVRLEQKIYEQHCRVVSRHCEPSLVFCHVSIERDTSQRGHLTLYTSTMRRRYTRAIEVKLCTSITVDVSNVSDKLHSQTPSVSREIHPYLFHSWVRVLNHGHKDGKEPEFIWT
jgi:hypothetical protein